MRSSYFFLFMVAHCVQLKIHPVKINIFSIDLKKNGNVHSFRKPYFSYSLTARALLPPQVFSISSHPAHEKGRNYKPFPRTSYSF